MLRIHPHRFHGVFTDGRRLYTQNFSPGKAAYDEALVESGGAEYRAWDPRRSKLAAYLKKGGQVFPFGRKSQVLYLGASSGTTASHVSDICPEGSVFCVEVSKIPFQKLLILSQSRKNIVPHLADAGMPESYGRFISIADVIYQDIAQRDQLWIFRKNLQFLRAGGTAFIAVKARSVDVTLDPAQVYREFEAGLRGQGLRLLQKVELAPYQEDHAMLVVGK